MSPLSNSNMDFSEKMLKYKVEKIRGVLRHFRSRGIMYDGEQENN